MIVELLREEPQLIAAICYAMIACGLVVLVVLLNGSRAPYGRFRDSAILSKLSISARLGWFIQEIPSLIIPLYYATKALPNLPLPNAVLLFFFIIHYAQRATVYPIFINSTKGTPIVIVLSAFIFCVINGYIQGAWHAKYVVFSSTWITSPLTFVGIILFLVGITTNIHSDSILRNLRRPGEEGYKIPRGGMFDYVSSANYFGECLEWIGYALMARTLPSFTFALFTLCNIGPRGLSYHRWYVEKFEDYPKKRKAIIPFVL
ncbi:hypothetical protein AB6A40_007487 [Gnathostoma spinigerum]|uniref:3-oxo-5alpha-steroid 4-dehydrogenase (NADP(+)) n=1 Tax=Gnathostoma spinigerum TaxID=75299 RepID=A0ABD6ELM4_9BILA